MGSSERLPPLSAAAQSSVWAVGVSMGRKRESEKRAPATGACLIEVTLGHRAGFFWYLLEPYRFPSLRPLACMRRKGAVQCTSSIIRHCFPGILCSMPSQVKPAAKWGRSRL